LATILSPPVVVVEARDDVDGEWLFLEEAAVVGRAVAARRREFATVRACARTALAGLGVSPAPILPGQGGAPRWPAGVVGSMTHCEGYRACAAASAARLVTIGIDAEQHAPLPGDIADLIALPQEREEQASLATLYPGICWDRVLFCIKESVYKAWFPLTHRWLAFDDALVTIDPATGRFLARLLLPGPDLSGLRLTIFRGRWLVENDLILAAVCL
jgi:4'-phosphopantetheinyl transferase EntD